MKEAGQATLVAIVEEVRRPHRELYRVYRGAAGECVGEHVLPAGGLWCQEGGTAPVSTPQKLEVLAQDAHLVEEQGGVQRYRL